MSQWAESPVMTPAHHDGMLVLVPHALRIQPCTRGLGKAAQESGTGGPFPLLWES